MQHSLVEPDQGLGCLQRSEVGFEEQARTSSRTTSIGNLPGANYFNQRGRSIILLSELEFMHLSELSTPLVCMAPAVHADERYAQIKTRAYQVAYLSVSRVSVDSDLDVPEIGLPSRRGYTTPRSVLCRHAYAQSTIADTLCPEILVWMFKVRCIQHARPPGKWLSPCANSAHIQMRLWPYVMGLHRSSRICGRPFQLPNSARRVPA